MNKYSEIRVKYAVKLEPFKDFLGKQNYEPATIDQYLNYIAFFLHWLINEGIEERKVIYGDLLAFIDYCGIHGEANRLINRKLAVVRKYYSFLQGEDDEIKNPATGLFLRGNRKTVPHNLLDKKELQQLYETYQTYDLRTKRNKIIISLLIKQALTTEELHKLEPTHINLKSAKIEVPGGKHSNGRILEIEANQILELKEYLEETRPAILKALEEVPKWAGRKAENPNLKKLRDQFLLSVNGSENLKNSLLHLMKALRKINPRVTNSQQIRQSVISLWLKTEDVRIVQYKAGHRYVSTTERYQENNLEDLKNELGKHHPLR